MEHDVFICHASEDKDDFVRPLAELLQQQHIEVWYDEFSLSIGDSLTRKIDEGLARSKFGVVILSPDFFRKPWAKRELSGLTQREMVEDRSLILPVWHRVSVQDVAQFSPSLADKKAVSSSEGINAVLREIVRKIKPDESPLLTAREHLAHLKLAPPPISDEWWLDLIEQKEFLKFPDVNAQKRWIFPLPYPEEDRGWKRGKNIASTALQSDWSFEGDELDISPTTHPEQVHEFISRWPGLYDCAKENPEMVALYAPQLTIPGFDTGFESVFDALLLHESKSNPIFSGGRLNTVDGKEPLCPALIAYRHPRLGNFTKESLAHWYFQAHDMRYTRSHCTYFEGLVWLASKSSCWLPQRFRDLFMDGILDRDLWLKDPGVSSDFKYTLLTKSRKQFRLSETIRNAFVKSVEQAVNNLDISDSAQAIVCNLLDQDLIERYYDCEDRLIARRKSVISGN